MSGVHILRECIGLTSKLHVAAVGLVSLVLAAPALAAGTTLSAHRAVYDISLKSAEERSGINGAQGRMVIEFAGSACEGWTINFRMMNQFFLNGGRSRILDSRSSMWESPDSDKLRYVQSQYVDSKLQEEKELKAELKNGKGAGAITKPKPEAFTLPGDVVFPVSHQLKLVEAAMAGKSRDETLLYDGSDGGNPAIAITFIGNKKQADAKVDSDKLKDTAGLTGWPVSISYYKPQEKEQETPDYQVNMLLFQNGVSGDMTLNYGDFILDAKLADLEMLQSGECNK
jgi:hypothetical protein